MSLRGLGPPFLLGALLLVLWEVYVAASGISPLVLPSPSRIVGALVDFRDLAWAHTVPTLVETTVGFTVSVVAAVGFAVAMDQVPAVRRAVYPLLVGSQTVPIIAIAPLIVIWFGFGLLPKVLVIVLVTFFPITVALLDGFATPTRDAADLMRTLGASDRQVFTKLRWPAALPSFFTGMRIAATYAVVGAIFAEYVGAFQGLGIWMQLARNAFRADLVFVAILIATALAIGLFLAVGALERLAIPWYTESRRRR
ncbi:MAG: ABC transporter permease [Chloroflexi bacterium]|nr:ABC transporter permease [Chloroflexota bacterium]